MAVRARRSGTTKAFVYAVVVHVLLIGLLVVSFQWVPSGNIGAPTPPKPIVNATTIDNAAVAREQARIKAEEQRRAQAQAAQEQAALNAQREAEAAAKARLAEEQRLKALKAQADVLAREQAQAKAAAAKAKAAAAKQKAAQAEKRREADLARQLAQEEAQREQAQAQAAAAAQAKAKAAAQAAATARMQSEIDRYRALIQQKVSRNWVAPPGTMKGLKCVVEVHLVPGGEVVDAKVVRGSGNAAFDRSVENAVYKASPLPWPAKQELADYFRDLEFTFNPEG